MEMEGAMEAAATVDSASLSWQDVQQICGEMEKMFQADAAKDADRLRALIDKRKAIAAAAQARQATASRQLQRTLSSCKPCGHSSSN
jgi:ribosomal protein L22